MDTVEIFSYRTREGCHVHGHKNLETGEEFIVLSMDPPPKLAIDRTTTKEWTT